MPIWPRAVAPPRLLQRSRELNARRTLIYKRRSFPHLWCHPSFRYRGFDESLIWLAILFLERRFCDFERFGNIDVLDPLSRIKGRSVFEIPKETVLRIFCLAGKIKKAGRRLFAFVEARPPEVAAPFRSSNQIAWGACPPCPGSCNVNENNMSSWAMVGYLVRFDEQKLRLKIHHASRDRADALANLPSGKVVSAKAGCGRSSSKTGF